ncbi:MAG: FdtA/QdtA family cupin domain-containing protein [Bacteroidota bacterium]|nr:FdtA/QdtA family cupin domain-containing protein [Bacteroidota bacterium]
MSELQLIDFGKIGSLELGYLTIAQSPEIQFPIKRVYWTYYSPNEVIRGHHAHKNLQQLLVAVSGQIIVKIENIKGEKFEYVLDKPSIGLYIPPFHWRTLQMSHSAVLLCLASEEYNEDDYIREYEEFKQYSK